MLPTTDKIRGATVPLPRLIDGALGLCVCGGGGQKPQASLSSDENSSRSSVWIIRRSLHVKDHFLLLKNVWIQQHSQLLGEIVAQGRPAGRGVKISDWRPGGGCNGRAIWRMSKNAVGDGVPSLLTCEGG